MKSEKIKFNGLSNCRDLGGFKGIEEKVTVPRMVFRSDSLDLIDDDDARRLKDEFGLKYVVDLRSEKEISTFPDKKIEGVTYYCMPAQDEKFDREAYPHKKYDLLDKRMNSNVEFLFHWDKDGDSIKGMELNYIGRMHGKKPKESFKRFFELLADSSGATLFHCHEGKDRTGILTALYLGVLGVSEDDIIDDYLATNVYFAKKIADRKKHLDEVAHLSPEDPMYSSLITLMGVHKVWIDAALNEIKKAGGFEEYLLNEVNLAPETIAKIRDKYLK